MISHWQRQETFAEEVLREQSTVTPAKLDELAAFYADRTPYFSLLTVIRYCAEHPAGIFGRYGPRLRPLKVSYSASDANVAVVEVQVDRNTTCVVAIQPGAAPNTWLLTTDSKPSSVGVSRGLEPLLDRLSSVLIGGWVSTQQLTAILREMEERTECQIRPSRVASRARGRSTVDWLEASSLKSVLSELREKKAFLQSLAFSLKHPDRYPVALKASVNRLCQVSYRHGHRWLLRRYLIDPLSLLLAHQASGLESQLETQTDGGVELRFTFDSSRLGDRESHEQLLDTIAQLPRLGVSAFHLNPYMQLSVVDYEDGSTMDVFSDDPSYVVFFPGPRCSSATILRVSSQLYSEFASGRLEKVTAAAVQAEMGFGSR